MGVKIDFTDICLHEERAAVRLLGATCNTPIGVHAVARGEDSISLTAFVGLPDGSRWIRDELEMEYPDAVDLIGRHVAARLRGAGADELLAEAERLVAAG
jgi:hydroxymethylbilane synthase